MHPLLVLQAQCNYVSLRIRIAQSVSCPHLCHHCDLTLSVERLQRALTMSFRGRGRGYFSLLVRRSSVLWFVESALSDDVGAVRTGSTPAHETTGRVRNPNGAVDQSSHRNANILSSRPEAAAAFRLSRSGSRRAFGRAGGASTRLIACLRFGRALPSNRPGRVDD